MRKGKRALLMLTGSIMTAVMMIFWPVKAEVEVETCVVQRGELLQSTLLNGMVRYRHEQPCINLKSGSVSLVCVQPGQAVRQGEILFMLDTAAEEQALASLYEWRYAHESALNQMDEAISVLSLQTELESRNTEAQLQAAIATGQIRAPSDGIVEAVYVQEGDTAAQGTVMGMVRGTEVEIVASAYAESLFGTSPGVAAIVKNGDRTVPVVLKRISSADSAGLQTLHFEAVEENALHVFEPGDTVQIELAARVHPVCALLPISAVDAAGMVWVVEDGKAYCHAVSLGESGRSHVSADLKWENQTVILFPEKYPLTDGMSVRVKK